MEDKTLEQMLKDFSRERGNRKSKVLTTVKPTGSATHIMGTVSLDLAHCISEWASLYQNTGGGSDVNWMRMKISMKSICRKRSIERIYV